MERTKHARPLGPGKGTLRISVSRDDLLVLAARAKGFRNGSSSTALLEMAEAHRRERAMNALLRVLARTVRVIEDVEPVEERRRATGRGRGAAAEERQERKHSRWRDES